ncbi:MAG: putative DNA-binding domain-containing protein [Proteobacteria bacterium]|nr:putative DNA-binding domain-containing protein [Pseudomonadota bacterium]
MHTAGSLLDLQRDLLAAVYDEDGAKAAAAVAGNGLDPATRLRIYRNSGAQIHAEALRAAYPAVLALVGEGFFAQCADRYRMCHPSRSGNLQAFGAHFAEFLELLPETNGLTYLGDVARLEWARQQAALAPDARSMTAVEIECALAAIGVDVHIALHPSTRGLASVHPVLTIWQYAMQPQSERLQLPTGGEQVVLWRSGSEVAMTSIAAASFACIDALAHGSTLEAAHAAARRTDPSFDLTECIAGLANNGLIAEFTAIQEKTT